MGEKNRYGLRTPEFTALFNSWEHGRLTVSLLEDIDAILANEREEARKLRDELQLATIKKEWGKFNERKLQELVEAKEENERLRHKLSAIDESVEIEKVHGGAWQSIAEGWRQLAITIDKLYKELAERNAELEKEKRRASAKIIN